MARGGLSKNTKRLAMTAVLAALGVVILMMGAVIEVLDISMAVGASLLLVPLLLEWGGMYPIILYAATGAIALIFIPTNFAAWLYLGFLGYYPMLKLQYEKLARPLSMLLKFLTMNAAIALYAAGLYFVILGGNGSLVDLFTKGFGDGSETISIPFGIILLVLIEIIFIVYDILLSRLILIYNYKWRQRFQRFFR